MAKARALLALPRAGLRSGSLGSIGTTAPAAVVSGASLVDHPRGSRASMVTNTSVIRGKRT
jgi:hypothetical protein